MSDGTTLNIGIGGDVIATEDPGLGYKIPVSKIRIGDTDIDGGDVTITNPFPILITDGSHGQVSLKAASTPAGATDIALVVAISPNNSIGITASSLPLPVGAATSALQGAGLPSAFGAGGGIKIDGSGTALPVSGSVTVSQSTASNLLAQIGGFAASGSSQIGNPVLTAGYDGSNVRSILTDSSGRQVFKSISSTTNQSTINASASNISLLSSNSSRIGSTIFNKSTAILYVILGSTASTSSFTVQINPSGYYETPFGYTGVVSGIWSSATGTALITELT